MSTEQTTNNGRVLRVNVVATKMTDTITVTNSSQGDYPVIVGPGAMAQIPAHIPGDSKKLLIIHAPALGRIA